MPWVWTDDVVAAIGDERDVDHSMIQTLRSAPVAIQASSGESMESIARRLGVLSEMADEEAEQGAHATG